MTTEQVDARPVLASALVTAIDHVGIAVADLDAAIKWYHDHLGMIVLHEEVNEEQGIREAMLSVRGAPMGSAQIQLMAPLDETSTIAKFLDKRGPGLQQLAYRVSDLDALSERLRDAGRPAALRRAASRHRELPDQLHPSQGCRRRADRARRARRRVTDQLRTTSASGSALRGAPARRVPVPPVVHGVLAEIGLPHHHMRCARPDLVIAARAAIGLGGPRRRRSAAPRSRIRRAPSRRGAAPAAAAATAAGDAAARRTRHATVSALRTAGTRRCPSRASGRNPKSRNGSRDRSPASGPAA